MSIKEIVEEKCEVFSLGVKFFYKLHLNEAEELKVSDRRRQNC